MTNRVRRAVIGVTAWGLALWLCLAGPSWAAEGPEFGFNIPSQRADRALTTFAKQAGVTLVFPFDLVSRTKANALVGRYGVEEGLALLLRGTDLRGVVTGPSELVIERVARTGESELNKNELSRKRSSFLGVLMALLGGNAAAQGSPPASDDPGAASGGRLEEIVVTARKSAENLQVVPLAITALTAETLERAGVRGIRDIGNLTPGLTMSGDDLERGQQPSIRGLSFSGDRSQEGNVAVMLDGIYVSNPGAMSLGIMDFERVEIVKGPQSALYGHNAFAGAINYVPKAPSEVLQGRAEVRAGNYDSYSAMVAVGGPLVEGKLYGRVAVGYDKAGGTYTDAVNGKDLGGFKKKDVDVALRYTPNDVATFDLGLYYGDDSFGRPMQASFPNNCARNAAGVLTQYCGELPSTESLLPLIAPSVEPVDATGNTRKVKHARLKGSFDFEKATVEVSAGYFDVQARDFAELFGVRDGLVFNLVGTPAGTVTLPGFFGGAFNNEDLSGEIRVSSKEDQRLRWSLGAYYFETDQDVLVDVGFNSDPIPAGRTIVCPSTFACIWQTPGGRRTANAGLTVASARQSSAFASLSFDATDALTVSAEARYTHEYKANDVLVNATAPTVDPDGPGGKNETYNFVNPRFTANYKLSPEHFLYVSAAKGTKAGGFNQRAIVSSELAYDPENNWTYEIGSKNTLLGGRVRLNVALFYVDWTDLQILVPSSSIANVGPVTQNYGSVQAKGGELEVAAQLADGITLNTGLAYTDPKFGSDAYDFSNVALCRLIPESCGARVVTNAPSPQGPVAAVSLDGLLRLGISRWQYTAGLDVNRPLTAGWQWFVNANYKYQSKQFTQIDNIRWIPERQLLSAQLGVQHDNLRISLWSQNLLNDLTPFATGGGQGITRYNNLLQVPKMSVPDRRRFGLQLNYSF